MSDTEGYPIDYVVICACGKGTRLEPITNHIPKYLVNPNNFNLLTIIVKYWKSYTKKIVLIIEEKYNSITDFYMKSLDVNYKIHNVDISNQGNCYTLYNALRDNYNNSRLLITWCDIFPTEKIPHTVFNNNVIFTFENECRYNYNNNIISPNPNGNVIGIYYFKDFIQMKYKNESDDIINVIPFYYKSLTSYELISLTDVGDMTKFLKYQNKTKTEYSTRYYNKITEVGPNLLKKELAHPDGLDIIKGEINFYRAIQPYALTCFPVIYELGETHFIMEKIHGEVLKDLPQEEYLEILIENLENLHKVSVITVNKTKFIEDLYHEFNSKIKLHIEKIKPLIDHFNYITNINDIKIQNFNMTTIIDDLYSRIERELIQNADSCTYNLIHADAHFCNTMIASQSKKIVFIDPYGRFGHSMIYGSAYFDFCLILFSLTGFDLFSSSKDYHFDISGTTINTNIFIKELENCKTIFKDHNINWNVCLYMCILHWVKFTFYTSNHILKSVAAYYHSMYLYHKLVLN